MTMQVTLADERPGLARSARQYSMAAPAISKAIGKCTINTCVRPNVAIQAEEIARMFPVSSIGRALCNTRHPPQRCRFYPDFLIARAGIAIKFTEM